MSNLATSYDHYATWVLLYQTAHLMNKALERQLQKLGLTLTQAAVLWLVDTNHSDSISDISRFLAREIHSISELIDRMENQGLVQRVKGNGKGNHIALTEKGREASRQAQIVANACEMMGVLSPKECHQFGSQLQALRNNVVIKLAQEKADSLVAAYSEESLRMKPVVNAL